MAISIPDLELVAAGSWQATEQARLGDWMLRAAEGFTGRSNSALAVGDPGLPLAEAVDQVCDWYRARGLTPMIAVPFPVGVPETSAVDRLLIERGWPLRSVAATVMTAPADVVPRSADGATATVDID